jgi:hypothetical protein
MTDVPAQAARVRNWLTDSRSDGYTINLKEFKDGGGYVVVVWANDPDGNLVGELRFKIAYPWLKIYRAFVAPEAGGRRLTCQMYMVAMAFAAEDDRILRVKAKEQDPTLINHFGFDPKTGILSLTNLAQRNALLELLDSKYKACEAVQKGYETKLGPAQILVITGNEDKYKDAEGVMVAGGRNTRDGNPLAQSANSETLWRLIEREKEFPTIVVDEPLEPRVINSAARVIADMVKRAEGEVYLNHHNPELQAELESRGLAQKTVCTNGVCHTSKEVCANGRCWMVMQ